MNLKLLALLVCACLLDARNVQKKGNKKTRGQGTPRKNFNLMYYSADKQTYL